MKITSQSGISNQQNMEGLKRVVQIFAGDVGNILNNGISLADNMQGKLLSVSLQVGDNVIHHLLGKVQSGWVVTDIDAFTVIYRNAPFNDETLTLNSSAVANVNIWVF